MRIPSVYLDIPNGLAKSHPTRVHPFSSSISPTIPIALQIATEGNKAALYRWEAFYIELSATSRALSAGHFPSSRRETLSNCGINLFPFQEATPPPLLLLLLLLLYADAGGTRAIQQ